jgi:hypothetical protein
MNSADNTPFRIGQAKTIADATTQNFGKSLYADALKQGRTAARNAMNNGGRGLSSSASNAYYAGQAEASGAAEGAQQRAGAEAEDQQFNEGQRNANQMLQEQARIFDKNQMVDLNNINFDRMFAKQQGQQSIAMARQRAAMQLRLALMSKGLD